MGSQSADTNWSTCCRQTSSSSSSPPPALLIKLLSGQSLGRLSKNASYQVRNSHSSGMVVITWRRCPRKDTRIAPASRALSLRRVLSSSKTAPLVPTTSCVELEDIASSETRRQSLLWTSIVLQIQRRG